MQLSQIIEEVNELADEQESPTVVTTFINDAIAKINIECESNFPSLSATSDDEPAFPEKWQRTLLIPFAVGRIKQRDSSQFEYSDAYSQFFDNLAEFKMKYTIPDIYLDETSQSSFESDIYTKPPFSWWNF